MEHRLFVLGSMGEFISLVKKAKERGIYTIVCDGYPDGPAREFADEDYVIPVTDIDRIAALCKEKKADGIITSFSDLLLECMVKIAHKAGLPCYLKPDQLSWYRDKSATKDLLNRMAPQKHYTPGFVRIPIGLLEDPEELSLHIKAMNFPMVTKPLDLYGSRGIYVVHDLDELIAAGRKTAGFSNAREILIEEYNDGHEFNLMSWVMNGKVNIISIADREKSPIGPGEIPISTRNVYPSRLYDQVALPAKELLEQFISCTGQRNGALSMQFFWKPEKGIQVCEIAARFFGYEHELTDIAFGFNMEDLLLNSLYDETALKDMFLHHDPARPKHHGAVLYFQGRLKKIQDLSMAQKLAQHPAVIHPWIFYKEGEEVIAHGPNPYVALYYISADSREELDQISLDFFQTMRVPDPDGKDVLYKNILPVYP